jgi:hypothetical protein
MFSVFNLFNHENLAAPSTSVTSNQFGWVTADASNGGSVGRWIVIQGRFKF